MPSEPALDDGAVRADSDKIEKAIYAHTQCLDLEWQSVKWPKLKCKSFSRQTVGNSTDGEYYIHTVGSVI